MNLSFNRQLDIVFKQYAELKNVYCNKDIPALSNKIEEKIKQLQNEQPHLSHRQLRYAARLVQAHQRLLSENANSLDTNLKKLCATILQQAEEITPTQMTAPPSDLEGVLAPEPILNVMICHDINATDHNGTILNDIILGMQNEISVVTTLPTFLGLKIKNHETRNNKFKAMLKIAIDKQVQIYRVKESGMLLIFPKNSPFSIDQLGFNRGNLEQTPLINLFKLAETDKQTGMENLIQLFNIDNQTKKRVYLNGHGSDDTIAALSLPDYKQLLSHLNQINTEALCISSCYAGGINTLEHKFSSATTANEEALPQFPIMVQSIGSFSTYNTNNTKTFSELFSSLDRALKSYPSIKNPAYGLRHEENFERTNVSKMQFPSHNVSDPTQELGFRIIDTRDCQSITLIEFKKGQLQLALDKGKLEVESKTLLPKIEINKPVINIYPLKVEAELAIVSTDIPFLHSAIPGKAQHFISKISSKHDLMAFFENNAETYMKTSASKAFFVKDFFYDTKHYKQMILEFNKNQSNCYYEKNGKYYQLNIFNGKKLVKNKISEDEYHLKALLSHKKTQPLEKAITISTGGQETFSLFSQNLFKDFWGDSLPKEVNNYNTYRSGMSANNFEHYFAALPPSCHQTVLELALLEKDDLLTHKILDNSLSLNFQDAYADIYLNFAASIKNDELCKLLIEKGCNPNLIEDLFFKNNYEFIDFVIKQPKYNINGNDGQPLLECIQSHNIIAFEKLLTKGADFKICKPSALMRAIHYNRPKQIELLLTHGASLDAEALETAAMHSSSRMLNYLLNKEQFPLEVLTKAVRAAAACYQLENIELLCKKDAKLLLPALCKLIETCPHTLATDVFKELAARLDNSFFLKEIVSVFLLIDKQGAEEFAKEYNLDLKKCDFLSLLENNCFLLPNKFLKKLSADEKVKYWRIAFEQLDISQLEILLNDLADIDITLLEQLINLWEQLIKRGFQFKKAPNFLFIENILPKTNDECFNLIIESIINNAHSNIHRVLISIMFTRGDLQQWELFLGKINTLYRSKEYTKFLASLSEKNNAKIFCLIVKKFPSALSDLIDPSIPIVEKLIDSGIKFDIDYNFVKTLSKLNDEYFAKVLETLSDEGCNTYYTSLLEIMIAKRDLELWKKFLDKVSPLPNPNKFENFLFSISLEDENNIKILSLIHAKNPNIVNEFCYKANGAKNSILCQQAQKILELVQQKK